MKESKGWGLYLWYPGELDWWIPARTRRTHDASAPAEAAAEVTPRMLRTYVVAGCCMRVLTFFGITIVIFVLVHSVPGDPITFYIGSARRELAVARGARRDPPRASPRRAARSQQYGWWLRGIVTLDFGTSFIDHRPVTERIAEKLPNTFILNCHRLPRSRPLIGVPIGLWSAARSGRPIERASAVTFFLLYSLPSFWVALLLMQFFAVRLNVLPLFGMTSDDYLDLDGDACSSPTAPGTSSCR